MSGARAPRPMSVGHVRAGYKYRPGAGCWVRMDLLASSFLSYSCASRPRIKCSRAFRHALGACGRSPTLFPTSCPKTLWARLCGPLDWTSRHQWRFTRLSYTGQSPGRAFGICDRYNGPVLVLRRLGPHCGTIPPDCLRSPPARVAAAGVGRDGHGGPLRVVVDRGRTRHPDIPPVSGTPTVAARHTKKNKNNTHTHNPTRLRLGVC